MWSERTADTESFSSYNISLVPSVGNIKSEFSSQQDQSSE